MQNGLPFPQFASVVHSTQPSDGVQRPPPQAPAGHVGGGATPPPSLPGAGPPPSVLGTVPPSPVGVPVPLSTITPSTVPPPPHA
jgi:hypothetical protein